MNSVGKSLILIYTVELCFDIDTLATTYIHTVLKSEIRSKNHFMKSNFGAKLKVKFFVKIEFLGPKSDF